MFHRELSRSPSPLDDPPLPFTQPIREISSPLLSALGTAPSPSKHVAKPCSTTDWARNIPYGNSPPDGYRTALSVTDSPRDISPPPDDLRNVFKHASPPSSPPNAYRLPTQRNNEHQSFGNHLSSSPRRGRPQSMQSHKYQSPPPPHQRQPHFYGAPDIDFGMLEQQDRSQKVSDATFHAFDNLTSGGGKTARTANNVLLRGYDNSLAVYKVDKDHLNVVGRLSGLRGRVLEAKIVPVSQRNDPFRQFRPLVVVLVHGPYDTSTHSRPVTSQSEDVMFDPSGSMVQALQLTDETNPHIAGKYQTTVEVYSLAKKEHIATLFKSPLVDVDRPFGIMGPSKAPLPVGNMTIEAKGRFIIVASGATGEVFIFEARTSANTNTGILGCIGKVWTSTLSRKVRSWSASSASSKSENSRNASPMLYYRPSPAICSLSQRWLAIVPPPTSPSCLHATVDYQSPPSRKPPGLDSHTAPSQPATTCGIETPDGDSMLNKVARDVTQELIKGAKWVGGQGMQAWNNYWSKPPDQISAASSDFLAAQAAQTQQAQPIFPPTHAQDNGLGRPVKGPTLISILDLERLSKSQDVKPATALQYVATFPLPYGCSLLSFTPSGLGLLTASAKGDVQHVWSLMRIMHGRTESSLGTSSKALENSPVVRQIGRFTRLTVASIVDIVWTEPSGERLAMITERGTVHIFDLPPSALQWPLPRRVVRSSSVSSGTKNPAPDHDSKSSSSSVPTSSTLGSAFSMFAGTSQAVVSAVRRPPSIGSRFPGLGTFNLAVGAGAKGGKAVAAGFSKSVGAAAAGTVSTIRHLGENRLTVPGSTDAICPGCVRWLSGKSRGSLAVTGGGIVRIYIVQQSTNREAGKRRPSVLGGKPIEYKLDDKRTTFSSNDPDLTARDPQKPGTALYGYWPSITTRATSRSRRTPSQPLSYAELETSAPYQPFHTDRRVDMSIYAETASLDPHHLHSSDPWAFGEPIAATKVTMGSTLDDNDEDSTEVETPGQMENVVSVEGAGEGQQIVVTTRRKRGGKGDVEMEEDFFEDDCEVVDFAEERV